MHSRNTFDEISDATANLLARHTENSSGFKALTDSLIEEHAPDGTVFEARGDIKGLFETFLEARMILFSLWKRAMLQQSKISFAIHLGQS